MNVNRQTQPIKRLTRGLALAAMALAAGQSFAGAPCSPADLNEDGFVDFSDYLDFLTRFDAGDLSVDYTADGEVDFSDYLEFLNHYEAGCLPSCSTTATELAAGTLPAFPFADHVQAYLDGGSVSISVDPAKLPGLTGKTTRVYITTNRTWAVGDTLDDVRGVYQPMTWPGGTIAASTFSLSGSGSLPADAGEDIGIGYDLIIDENSNGVFDACDVIDGVGPEGGFYKIKDLTTPNAATAVTTVNNVPIPAGTTTAGWEACRWYYPTNIASRGQLPLVVISHGNGHSYTWYDFLGQHLASYGMIVISHTNNTGPGIPTASQTQLDHTNTIIRLQATLGGGVLNGHINQSEIYSIGHSRGGECVALSYDRLAKGLYTPTGGHPRVINLSDIKYIQSIAPVDFQGRGSPTVAGSDPGAADFMLLYGAADGDVCGCPGFDLAWSFNILERADQRRNSVYIHGVGHNEFNCCGFADATGPALIGRAAAQGIQKATTLASIKYYRNGNIPSGEVLWRQYETFKPGATLATAIVDNEFKDFGAGRTFVIDDFQTQTATGTSSSGGAVSFTVGNFFEGQMRDQDGTYAWSAGDPMNGMSRGYPNDVMRAASFDYNGASFNYTFDIVPAGRDTTPYRYVSFRAAQITRHPFTTAVLGDHVFEVELEDGAGNTSRIRINAYGGGIEEVYQRESGWQNELETIRLPLADFTADGRTLDLADVRKVRLLFGSSHGNTQGRLGLDDLEFSK